MRNPETNHRSFGRRVVTPVVLVAATALAVSSVFARVNENMSSDETAASASEIETTIKSSKPEDIELVYLTEVESNSEATLRSDGLLKAERVVRAKGLLFEVHTAIQAGERETSFNPSVPPRPVSDKYQDPADGEKRAIEYRVPPSFAITVASPKINPNLFTPQDKNLGAMIDTQLDAQKKTFFDVAAKVTANDKRFGQVSTSTIQNLNVGEQVATIAAGASAELATEAFITRPEVTLMLKQSLAEQVIAECKEWHPTTCQNRSVADVEIEISDQPAEPQPNDKAKSRGTYMDAVNEFEKNNVVPVGENASVTVDLDLEAIQRNSKFNIDPSALRRYDPASEVAR